MISKDSLRAAVRIELANRGWVRKTGAHNGPLPDSFPDISGGWYWVPTPFRAGLIVGAAQEVIDRYPRVGPRIFDCKEYGRLAHGLAMLYLVEPHPITGRPRYDWLFNDPTLNAARPAVCFIAGIHAQAGIYTTRGFRFWEPQFQGGGLMPPQPHSVRQSHWSLTRCQF